MNVFAPFKLIAATIKKIVSHPAVKRVIESDYLMMIIAVVLVVALIGLLIYLRRRKSVDAQVPQAMEPGEIDAQDNLIKPASLLDVWKTYIKKIPAEFRRSILFYSPFVVLGESGSGKSALIDTYSDWKNQSDQFYPSHTDNPDLQVFQGSNAIIQELSPAILHNATNHARIALVKLWKAFYKREEITAIITIRSDDIRADNKESLVSQAQIIRGKLNILSRLMKKAVTVHIAVTFMDEVVGFLEFSNFSRNKAMSTHVNYEPGMDLASISSPLFKKNLTNVLVSEPSQDFLKLLAFFNEEPRIYSGLKAFIDVLLKEDPLTRTPAVKKIFFGSIQSSDPVLSNPFRKILPKKRFWQKHPYFKHQVTACILLMMGSAYLGFSHSYEKQFFNQLHSQMQEIQDNISIADDKNPYLTHLLEKAGTIQSNKTLPLLYNFYPEAEAKTGQTVLSVMRKELLVNKLNSLKTQVDPFEEVRMMLALIYASNNNRLGKIILENLDYWTQKTRLPVLFITSYIGLSDRSWDVKIPLAGVKYRESIKQTDNRPLRVFINSLKSVIGNNYLAQDKFVALQKDAKSIFETINSTSLVTIPDKLLELLNQETVLTLETYEEKTAQTPHYQALKEFLYKFQQLSYDFPDVTTLNLGLFFENLTAMSGIEVSPHQKTAFEMGGIPYLLDLSAFDRVVKLSSLVSLIRQYVSYNSYGGRSFFNPDREYEDLDVSLSTEDKFFFTTKKKIDGRYTKKTYDEEVKPVLEKFPQILENLPISMDDKNYLSGFIYKESEAYAEKYVAEYTHYYSNFRMKADSIGELRFIIKQILMPMSQFQEFMMILKTNLDLEYGKNSYFKPIMMNLGSLGFVKVVMQDQKNFFPELESYKSILKMVLEDLENGMVEDSVDATAEKPGEANGLASLLSPAGRIALSILRNDRESYLKLFQKWEKSVGIPEHLGYAFVEPIYQLYRLSLPELDEQIAKIWNGLKTEYITPQFNDFPFKENASTTAEPEKIINLLKPTGDFWKNYNRFIGPVIKKNNDLWVARDYEMGNISLPEDLLGTANALKGLGKLLLDETGQPIPLLAEIKADILPLIEKNTHIVVLTYLQSDTNSVYGFNQKPSWKKFKINWWKQSQSSIGVEFSEGEKNEFKIYRNHVVPNSYWSFYRLLADGEHIKGENAWAWNVDSPEDLSWKRSVKFFIRENPFSVFQKHRVAP
jgi:hypothetical protein